MKNARSDVDVLISFNEEPSLYGFIELENKLSELLEAKVDLVEKSALKPAIGGIFFRRFSTFEQTGIY